MASGEKRSTLYEAFSEFVSHPTKSGRMMRLAPEDDAVIGPFGEATPLGAVVLEMRRLAIEVGEKLSLFFQLMEPQEFRAGLPFAKLHRTWISTFHPTRGRVPHDASGARSTDSVRPTASIRSDEYGYAGRPRSRSTRTRLGALLAEFRQRVVSPVRARTIQGHVREHPGPSSLLVVSITFGNVLDHDHDQL
jgi:hypothetical protein